MADDRRTARRGSITAPWMAPDGGLATLPVAGDNSEQQLREGYMAMVDRPIDKAPSKRGRRASLTALIKKKSDDDERVYFLLTPVDLQQFTAREDFKGGADALAKLPMGNYVLETLSADAGGVEFVLRGAEKVYTFRCDDDSQCARWTTAVRAVQMGIISEWSTSELITFGRNIAGISGEFLSWVTERNCDGMQFLRLKDIAHLSELGYKGPSDAVFDILEGLRTSMVHDWLTRFVSFCRANSLQRDLTPSEMLSLIQLGKALEIMNTLMGTSKNQPAVAAAADGISSINLADAGGDSDDEDEVPDMVVLGGGQRRASIQLDAVVDDDDC